MLMEEVSMTSSSRQSNLLVRLISVLFATSATILAQSSGIIGTVTDESVALVPGVAVTATNLGTDVKRETLTNEVGKYSLPNIPIGTYRVTAERAGFRRQVV